MPLTDRRGGDVGRGPSPDLEQLMHVLVRRAKLLLSLRGVVLAQKVRSLFTLLVMQWRGVLSGCTLREPMLPHDKVATLVVVIAGCDHSAL